MVGNYSLRIGMTGVFASRETNLIIYIYIYIYDTKLISLHKYFNQVLLTKLFADTNIAHIFCKIGQTSNTNTNDDYQFGTEGAILTILDRL
jgi:hypothetical protein